MVDETRHVALAAGIDEGVPIDLEEKCVVMVHCVVIVAFGGLGGADALANILDDTCARSDASDCEGAPPVDERAVNFERQLLPRCCHRPCPRHDWTRPVKGVRDHATRLIRLGHHTVARCSSASPRSA